jgi:hypothetical protein
MVLSLGFKQDPYYQIPSSYHQIPKIYFVISLNSEPYFRSIWTDHCLRKSAFNPDFDKKAKVLKGKISTTSKAFRGRS